MSQSALRYLKEVMIQYMIAKFIWLIVACAVSFIVIIIALAYAGNPFGVRTTQWVVTPDKAVIDE